MLGRRRITRAYDITAAMNASLRHPPTPADDAGSSRLVLLAGLPAGMHMVPTGPRAVRLAME